MSASEKDLPVQLDDISNKYRSNYDKTYQKLIFFHTSFSLYDFLKTEAS